ncbi:UV-endonuclease UvdE [Trichodelitschia bisporula]|uniref:UV-endonuclease UvdE n=1 Tax=Trichodelitschia bisporula TaxID=703511 RepID=A0A6G1HHR7_9PEZI|nr:UV-endonuclease UvdE [Trichodelitschia bisporula]
MAKRKRSVAVPKAEATPASPPPKRVSSRRGAANTVDDAAVPDSPVVNGTSVSAVPAVKPDPEVGCCTDPEEDACEEEDALVAATSASRPPPVNSDYLPLPWKGRLGYACLNTYLRSSTPSVFSSRTCRIQSILDHRHPLKDPHQPESTKNKPDKTKRGDVAIGQKWVEGLGLANARDIIKMLRWNERYGIKFMRLSSEMFPFASHPEYGYKLAPFAAETLAKVGEVIAELGHRVTTHPGQFTQLGSPRKQVVDNAIRDLTYHDEMLSLLKLPPQQDRDAIMILHMGGTFGSKEETLDRFRKNYAPLSQSIKNRLVLENDDMSWSVHDLLPICQELNIPMVLDFHHHNIIFDKDKIREGTKDIVELFPAIRETWTRKRITQKMHYSESTPAAVTPMKRRKHSPRVATLPPCAPDMDLMIEAKDKEQAVFELMRTFKLPGFDLFNDVIPHVREDENRPKSDGPIVPDDEVGMGGPERRVYWPPGMEEWLKPMKRVPAVAKALPKVKREVGGSPKQPRKVTVRKKVVKEEELSTPSVSDEEQLDLSGKEEPDMVVPLAVAAPSRRSARTRRVNYAEADEAGG